MFFCKNNKRKAYYPHYFMSTMEVQNILLNNTFLSSFFPYSAEILLLVGILILLLESLFTSTSKKYLLLIDYSSKLSVYLLSIVQLFNILTLNFTLTTSSNTFFGFLSSFLIVNSEVLSFKIFIVFLSMLIILFSINFFKETLMGYFEYNILVLCALFGSLITLSANDFLILYISLEIQALAFYIIATIKKSSQSTEAGLKYFIIGSFSSAVLLFGISVVVLLTGHHNFDNIQSFLYFNQPASFLNLVLFFGVFLIFTAFLIKLAIAPFHEWVADIYEGVLTPTALLFSTVPKIVLFFMLIKLYNNTFENLIFILQPFLAFACFFSLILGSLSALKTQNIKRFLAFSSVNHFGFMLIGLISSSLIGINASLLYLFVYIFLTFGIWSLLILLSYTKINGNRRTFYQLTKIPELGDLIKNNPGLAFFAFSLLLSMGGIPPLAGFSAKISVIYALLENTGSFIENFENISGLGFNLILFAVFFSSVLSVFYYLRIIKVIFTNSRKNNTPLFVIDFNLTLVLGIICTFNFFFIMFI